MSASPALALPDDTDPALRAVLAAHEGGKLGVHADQAAARPRATSPSSTRPASPTSPGRSPPTPLSPRGTPRGATPSPSSATAPRSSGSETSAPCRAAGHGGQGGPLQALRGHRRGARLHGDRDGRRARRGDRPDRAVLRRHQPRGHLGTAVLRHRGRASRSASTSPSSTTTSTGRRSSSSPACSTRPASSGKQLDRGPGRRQRRRGRRRRGDPAPRSGPACPTSSSATPAASSPPARPELPDAQAPAGRDDEPAGRERAGRRTALAGADVFIGVSRGDGAGGATWPGWPSDAIIFALANPDPEVHPDVAHRYAAVVATGRSDFPNQINNVLAFPGIFRGALDSGATPDHRGDEGRRRPGHRRPRRRRRAPTRIVPSVFDPGVAEAVAAAVASAR